MTEPPSKNILKKISAEAKKLGFAKIGFTPITPLERGTQALQSWLNKDLHGQMEYMKAHGLRNDPTIILKQATGVIVVALPYHKKSPQPTPALNGIVAQYAKGPDYHQVLKEKLFSLAQQITQLTAEPVLCRPCVDTAPLLERELAEASGVGFVAKSTMTLIPGIGTYTLLGELLVNMNFPDSTPMPKKCGECTACLDACPTKAFIEPYVLDARRCISYLTIESKAPIPRSLRSLIGNHIFGCDICQEVCPFNASPKPSEVDDSLAPLPHLQAPELETLLHLRSGEYRRFVKGTALRRANRAQLGRNAAVALGNSKDKRAIPILIKALKSTPPPLVRGHVAWALGELGGPKSEQALREEFPNEKDPWVKDEIQLALTNIRENHQKKH